MSAPDTSRADRARTYASDPVRPESTRPEGPRTTPIPARDERSVGQLLRELSDESTTLFRQEVRLAKAEVTEKIAKAGRNIAAVAVGGLVAFGGYLVLLTAITYGLSVGFERTGVDRDLRLWLAPLIVAIVVLGIGAALALKGLKALKGDSLAPTRTADSIRETKDWIKEKIV